MKPLLVLAWGNRSRGDDALGPLLLDRLGALQDGGRLSRAELLEAHQLQPEHAFDLAGRERVLLVDAARHAPWPFGWRRVAARRDASIASHALSPEALLAVFDQAALGPPPPVCLLALPAVDFTLGRPPRPEAAAVLEAAARRVLAWIDVDETPGQRVIESDVSAFSDAS